MASATPTTAAVEIACSVPRAADDLRSLYSSDPYVNLTLDEFRIYRAALSPGEIAATDAMGPDQLLSPDQPAVALTAAGANLTLTWPVASAGFTVQLCTNLASGSWVVISSPVPQIIGGQWQVSLPPSTNAATFFRLAK